MEIQMTIRIMTDIYDKFDFGKHKGKTVRFVLENEPSYILWCDEQKVVEFSKSIIETAIDNDFDDAYPVPWHGDVNG
jgi:hypothetical protein